MLRKRTGDGVEIVDSAAVRFDATLRVDGHRVQVELREVLPIVESGLPWHVAIAQAVPKGAKMDFIVEKATELGAAEILPFYCERTISEEISAAKLARWRRLATTASQQCGRTTVPAVTDPKPFEAILAQSARFDVVLFPWELSPVAPLRERLPALLDPARSVLVIVGPEGGFSADEAERAAVAGAHVLSLGNRILRTETAAMVMLSFLNYLA